MKYGVIICPKCGKARGVETARKTVTCQCGRQIKLQRLKPRFLTDSPLELAETVQKVNASLKGAGPMPKERRKARSSAVVVDKEKLKNAKDPLEKARVVLEGLSKKKPEFGADDLTKMSAQIGGKPEDIVERLLEGGVIYEVAPGRFRVT
jgi:uncharacterized Zn finger protein (UPF0148 family)